MCKPTKQLILTTRDQTYDKLIIQSKKSYIYFSCLIDNSGNQFKVSKEELNKLIV